MKYEIVDHQFKPGETISAVIKLYNGYSLQKYEHQFILNEFFEINSKDVPRVGSINKIPVLINE